jgi:3-oxoacyl-[acyl-carrier-protein] synthase-1
VTGLSIPVGRQHVAQPYFAPIAALPEEMGEEIRITIMAREALAQACSYLPEDRDSLRLLVLTLLPASSAERPNAGNLDRNDLAGHLRETHPTLALAEIRFVETDNGATFQLAQCSEELHQGQWDAVLFGGVDSLIDRETIQLLAVRGICCTDRYPEGTLPGEGAAYLLLEKPDGTTPARAVIAGLGHALEPNHRQGHNRPMTALAASIEQALGQAKCTPSQVETLVLPMGNDVLSALEWHQVNCKFWAKPGEDSDFEMEELTPHFSIGDTGAATLPLALVIGCARFEFNFPSADRILVCEVGHGAPRGAVFLKKPKEQAKPAEG